jgi:hypothetical protein
LEAMAYREGGLRSGSVHDPELLAAALVGYEQQRSEIEKKIAELRRQLGGRGAGTVAPSTNGAEPARRRRQMSAAGRKRIAAAQQKRWAAARQATNHHAAPAAKPAKKRMMSAAARKRISEATKKRWAAYRAKKATPKEKTASS